MKRNKAIIVYLAAIFSNIIWAGTMGEYKSDTYCASCRDNPLQQVITFSIGPAWSNNGKTQTLILQPDLEKTYSATFHSNILPYGELFFGFQKRLNSILYNQLGLEIAGGGEAKLRGDIWEDADPDFNNYRYTYAISELRVMARTKFLIDIFLSSQNLFC